MDRSDHKVQTGEHVVFVVESSVGENVRLHPVQDPEPRHAGAYRRDLGGLSSERLRRQTSRYAADWLWSVIPIQSYPADCTPLARSATVLDPSE